MASCGGTSCDILRGTAPVQRERVDIWESPGFDGYGAQVTGAGDAQCRFTAIKFGSAAAVNTWVATLQAMQGALVTVINDRGDSYSTILLVKVGNADIRPVIGAAGAASATTRGQIELLGVVT